MDNWIGSFITGHERRTQDEWSKIYPGLNIEYVEPYSHPSLLHPDRRIAYKLDKGEIYFKVVPEKDFATVIKGEEHSKAQEELVRRSITEKK